MHFLFHVDFSGGGGGEDEGASGGKAKKGGTAVKVCHVSFLLYRDFIPYQMSSRQVYESIGKDQPGDLLFALMYQQILRTDITRKIWQTIRRICGS